MKKFEKIIFWFLVNFSACLLISCIVITQRTEALREEVIQTVEKVNALKIKNAALQHQLEKLRNVRRNGDIHSTITKAGIYVPHLRRVVKSTIEFLNLKGAADWERLVLLTIAAESDCGHYLKQVKGPAKGIAQLEEPTEVDVLAFYKRKMPITYKKIQELTIPADLSVHQAEGNLPYAIAMCIGEYLRRGYRPYGASTEELARAWKVNYNTVLGRGTVAGALRKNKKYIGE